MKLKWLFWNSSKLTLLQLQVDQKHGFYVMLGQINQRSDSSKFVVEKYFGIWPRFYIIKTNFSQVRSRICVFASTLWNISLRNMIVLTKAFEGVRRNLFLHNLNVYKHLMGSVPKGSGKLWKSSSKCSKIFKVCLTILGHYALKC